MEINPSYINIFFIIILIVMVLFMKKSGGSCCSTNKKTEGRKSPTNIKELTIKIEHVERQNQLLLEEINKIKQNRK